MTRLRWGSAPYEFDPAHAQPLPAANWPRRTSGYRADPNDVLMNQCLRARRAYLRAVSQAQKLRRQCRNAEVEFGKCRIAKKERAKDKIASLERELAVANASSEAKLRDYLALVSLWRERHPTEK